MAVSEIVAEVMEVVADGIEVELMDFHYNHLQIGTTEYNGADDCPP